MKYEGLWMNNFGGGFECAIDGGEGLDDTINSGGGFDDGGGSEFDGHEGFDGGKGTE